METAPGAERLAAARSELSYACDRLIAPSPEALEQCQSALERAIKDLGVFRAGRFAAGDRGVLPVAEGLRSDVRRAARLLQSLADFHRGWERILGSRTGGYTPSGDAAPVARQGRICCRG